MVRLRKSLNIEYEDVYEFIQQKDRLRNAVLNAVEQLENDEIVEIVIVVSKRR